MLAVSLTVFAAVPVVLYADVNGADPRLTGAPGENTCVSCHGGTALNGGGGALKITLDGGSTYTPGVAQKIHVQVSDPAARRWGFELSARPVSALTTQAGDLTAADSNAQILCATGRQKPCSSAAILQFATHTLSGTRAGTTGGVTFDVNWTPPSTDVGAIRIYASGNAANGNNQDTGDHIYNTSIDLQPATVSVDKPVIEPNGVESAASLGAGLMPNGWIAIKGTNLATTTRLWSGDDIVDGKLPTTLDGVSVTVNGKAAYVQYVSPTQVNVLTPPDDSVGPVEVKVAVNGQTSDPASAVMQTVNPGLFTFDGQYAAATHVDGTLVGKAGLFASAPNATSPVKPGETVILYGTGFGATSPAITAGQVTDKLASITTAYVVTIGGVQAKVSFGGLVPPFAGVFQLNVEIPAGLADGDQPVVIQMNGINSSPASVTVQQ